MSDPGSGAVAAPGPFSLRAALALLLGVLLGACASARPDEGETPRAGPEETAGGPGPATEEAGSAAVLRRLVDLRSTRPSRAAALADSAFFRWRDDPGRRTEALQALLLGARALEDAGELVDASARLEDLLGADPSGEVALEAAERAARLHIVLGREPSAVRALVTHGNGLPADRRLDLLARAASGMSAAELRDALAERPDAPSAAASVLRAELGRVLALTGRTEEARRVVREAVPEGAPPGAVEMIGRVREGRISGADRGEVRIEAVLPLSGSLAPVGESLRQGMKVALEQHRRAGGDSVVVRFRDDRSRVARSGELVRAAEASGAAAVVGPARSGALAAALEDRDDPALPVVSPTAVSPPREGWNGYTLWGLEDRERLLAEAVGRWLVERAGIGRLAVLRPRDGAGQVAEHAFRAGAGRWGAAVLASAAYVPDSTTFEDEIRRLSGPDPGAVFVASRNPRNALQIAPQLSYYGLGSAAVAGGSAWGEPAVVRRLRGGSPSLFVTAVFTDRGPETAWTEFRAMYERKYDKQLSENVLPALGYDAMKAVLAAVDSVGLSRRGALSRALAAGPVRGATGRLRFRVGRPAVQREPGIRLGTDGELRAAEPDRLIRWMREVEERQEMRKFRRQERAAERVRRWSGSGGGRR